MAEEVKVREEKKNASKSATKDMTVGSPMRLILGFSIPLLCGALFQQFYSVVDTVIVGRILGVNALAGVGATGSVNFITAEKIAASHVLLAANCRIPE